MKITVKTLQQKQFQVDAEPEDSVGTLKSKIAESQGHAVEHQKLIYSGKILPDDKTIESCAIKEKDFLVLMVSKAKPPPAPAAEAEASSSSSSLPALSSFAPPTASTVVPPPQAPVAATTPVPPQVPSETTAAVPSPATPAATTPAAAPVAQQPAAFGDMSSFVTGDALQTTVQNMVDMGFERAQVMRALKASFNNPDRAVEYLMNGIPAHLQEQAAPATPPAATPAAAAPAAQVPQNLPAAAAASAPSGPQNLFQMAQQQQQQQRAPGGLGAGGLGAGGFGGLGGAGEGAGAGGLGPAQLEGMRNNPSFQQIRELVQQNPALIQPLIQQLAASNPGLAQALTQNPELLYQILGTAGAGGEFGDDDEEGGAGGAPPPGAIQVTQEEMSAIERLQGLGFSRDDAIRAYFACDKNEELAANFLFDGGFGE